MKCPSLLELPPTPANRTGWPWTEESPQLPNTMDDGKPWQKISIVTPSYNQAQFIEETIRSVLLQGYPNLEYIIIDGGSTDNSIDIIRKYEPWISYWISEPDNGQSEAINKGWHRSKGEILAYINSDDTYDINTLQKIARFLSEQTDVEMVYGDCDVLGEEGQFIKKAPTKNFCFKSLVCNEWFIPQQSTFIRHSVIKEVGKLNENLHLVMDWELWLRIALKGFKIYYLPEKLANFRRHDERKTSSQSESSAEEKISVLNNVFTNSELASKIKNFKNDAYYYVHQWACNQYDKNENEKKAFSHYIKSIMYKPGSLRKKNVIKKLLIYLIGRSRYMRYRNYFSFVLKF